MKKSKLDPVSDEQAAVLRIADLEDKFRKSSSTLSTLIAGLGQTDGQTPKAVMSKLMELETVHATILKSQESFHEKYSITNAAGGVDYDEIRCDLGRQLDRIRAAIAAGGFSEGAG